MKNLLFKLFLFSLPIVVIACNNESDSTVETDTTTTENTVTTTNTSTGDYAAQAETYRAGNDAGAYIDARTGTTVRINVDPQTGIRTNVATGEPVWRYIDTRTWQVYTGDSWDPIAEARREGNTIVFKAEDGSWVSYDTRWPNDETEMKDYKTKIGDTKVKVSEDGDIKVKDEKGKVKYDADDNKVKTDSSR